LRTRALEAVGVVTVRKWVRNWTFCWCAECMFIMLELGVLVGRTSTWQIYRCDEV
jgi:hypothetical protein